MADPNDRTFQTDTVRANRAAQQGLGEGQREIDAGRDPGGDQTATNPEQRSFQGDIHAPTNADRPSQADFGEDGAGRPEVAAETDTGRMDPDLSRNEAGLGDVGGDLGAGTPANVDVHKLGQEDRPQEDWGQPAAEGATFSANHTGRGERLDAERGQGAKTRAANKDIVSRRS